MVEITIITENPNKPIIISENNKDKVFFMIQEMEAWMLKQPEAIELWGTKNSYQRNPLKGEIARHPKIGGKDIETIKKPSDVLAEIIQQYFKDTIRKKKIKYGKLKTAPFLLDCLDVKQLKGNDSEIHRFCEYVSKIIIRCHHTF